MTTATNGRADWTADELKADPTWIYTLSDSQRAEITDVVRSSHTSDKGLLDYRRSDFPFRHSLSTLREAFEEALNGRGIALVKGLPRESVSASEFELMTWAVGLHVGVPRPQNKLTAYVNEVRDIGTVYRSPTGRGYSSNAELDFHVDGADLVALTCYNTAKAGGASMASSSTRAFQIIRAERPDLAEALQQPYVFGLQAEQASGAAPYFTMPIYGFHTGRTFCTWVRNRVENGMKIAGAPQLTPLQIEAMDFLDEVVRRPALMLSMDFEPGDMQILNNHVILHSRTSFEDYDDEERKRLLYRLWLSPPDAPALPAAWAVPFGTSEPGVVRGGIKGQHYDERCRRFDAEQAATMDMVCP